MAMTEHVANARVLIIDDHDEFRWTMRDALASAGGSAVEARNVTFASSLIQRKRFGLIIARLQAHLARNVAALTAIRLQTAIPILFVGLRGAPVPPSEFGD